MDEEVEFLYDGRVKVEKLPNGLYYVMYSSSRGHIRIRSFFNRRRKR